ncbi:MAG: arginase family protein [Bacteroidota bacterium]
MIFKTLETDKNFLGIEPKFSNYRSSKVVILPVPYEHTTSYGVGTKLGPRAILNASHYVEFYDEETERELHMELGIATLRPLDFERRNRGARVHEKAIKLIYDVVR